MKRLVLVLILVAMVAAPGSVFARANGYFIDLHTDKIKALYPGDAITMEGPFGPTMVFEGATEDAYETTLTFEDPTADIVPTIPNMSSTTGTVSIAVGIAGDVSDTTAVNATAFAYTFTTGPGTLDAGDALRITFFGTKTGANAAGEILLMAGVSGAMAEAAALTLTTDDIQFHGQFIINVIEASETFISGFVQGDTSAGATGDAACGTYTTTDPTTTAIAFSLGMVSAHGSDTVVIYSAIVEQL